MHATRARRAFGVKGLPVGERAEVVVGERAGLVSVRSRTTAWRLTNDRDDGHDRRARGRHEVRRGATGSFPTRDNQVRLATALGSRIGSSAGCDPGSCSPRRDPLPIEDPGDVPPRGVWTAVCPVGILLRCAAFLWIPYGSRACAARSPAIPWKDPSWPPPAPPLIRALCPPSYTAPRSPRFESPSRFLIYWRCRRPVSTG